MSYLHYLNTKNPLPDNPKKLESLIVEIEDDIDSLETLKDRMERKYELVESRIFFN